MQAQILKLGFLHSSLPQILLFGALKRITSIVVIHTYNTYRAYTRTVLRSLSVKVNIFTLASTLSLNFGSLRSFLICFRGGGFWKLSCFGVSKVLIFS